MGVVQMTAGLKMKDPGLLTRTMTARIQKIVDAEEAASKAAATTATKVTQGSFKYKRPANAPSRENRPSTGGKFPTFLKWNPMPDGGVAFDIGEADIKVRYWIIQEIGTGESAVIRRGGAKNPQGRPGKGADYVRTVKKQRGRLISGGLAFGTGPSGTFVVPQRGLGNQQLYLRSALKKAPLLPNGPKGGLYISKEIEGQGFVRKGGEAGFLEYQTMVLAAARRVFAGTGRRP